jgi:hypothetical protein
MFLSISAYDFELGLLPSTHSPDGALCLLVAAVVVAVAVVFVAVVVLNHICGWQLMFLQNCLVFKSMVCALSHGLFSMRQDRD